MDFNLEIMRGKSLVCSYLINTARRPFGRNDPIPIIQFLYGEQTKKWRVADLEHMRTRELAPARAFDRRVEETGSGL